MSPGHYTLALNVLSKHSTHLGNSFLILLLVIDIKIVHKETKNCLSFEVIHNGDEDNLYTFMVTFLDGFGKVQKGL